MKKGKGTYNTYPWITRSKNVYVIYHGRGMYCTTYYIYFCVIYYAPVQLITGKVQAGIV